MDPGHELPSRIRGPEAAGQATLLGWTPLLALLPQGVVLVGADGVCLEANPAALRMLGLEREALLALPWRAVFGELPAPTAGRMAATWVSRAGAEVRLEVTAEPGPEGSLLLAFVDGTEARPNAAHLELDARRRAAEQAERESRARLQRAESVAAFGNWELSLADGTLHASRGAHLIYGVEERALTLAEVQARVLPEDRPALDEALRALVEENRPYQVEFRIQRAKDGELRAVHSFAEYDADRRTVFGVLNDITERKRMEDALRESEIFFKEAQRAAAIGSYKADFVTGTWTSSPVLDAIFGIGPGYLRSIQGWVALIHPEDRGMMEFHLASEVIQGRRPFDREYRIVRPGDGAVRWVRGLGAGTFDDQGTFLALIGTIKDITEQKEAALENAKLHGQLVQAQKMESLGVLAGGVAHDMNNVLGAVLALASAHLTLEPEGSPLHQALDTIREAAERGGTLAKSLLNFARKSPPREKQNVALNALLLEEARLLERTTLAKVHLELVLAPDLRDIRGDAGALSHAFMNLCVNAVDAMDEGGTLTLATRNVGEDQAEVRVEDNGSGMTEEVLAKAFDPFFTTKAPGKGTGLGLSMVYATVKDHQGRMEIHSRPGQGTRVSLVFPVLGTRALDPGSRAPAPLDPVARPLSVLLVDDDDLVLRSTRTLCEVLGHAVAAAASGEEALAMLERGFRPDLVILDLSMPGLGGKGTLPRLRALCPEVPVLLATGRADQEALDLVTAHAQVSLLSKPFSLEDLHALLRRVGPELGQEALAGRL